MAYPDERAALGTYAVFHVNVQSAFQLLFHRAQGHIPVVFVDGGGKVVAEQAQEFFFAVAE